MASRDRDAAEVTRQTIHVVTGLWALCLRWVGTSPLMVFALLATAFNVWLLPRLGGRWLWRRREAAAGWAAGIVFYPLTVFLLLAVFYRRPEVAGAGWGLLAFGDGVATLAGERWGRARLPWNREKTWVGSLAYFFVGGGAVILLVSWIVPGRYEFPFLALVGAAVALLATLLESAPQKLDDNLGVPLVASLFLLCALDTAGGWQSLGDPSFRHGLLWGLACNVVLVALAHSMGTLTRSGALVACLIGTLVVAFLSWRGYVVLLVFFALGSIATRIGYVTKAGMRLAQGRGGSRRAANALANGGVAVACAVFAGLTPNPAIFVLAFACSLAAAAADTVESEIGQLWGRPTVLITSFEIVDPGTDGGVSTIGTIAGMVAALLTVGAGWLAGLYPVRIILPLSGLALSATLAESLVGATLERAGLLDNDGVNFFNTLLAAILGAGLATIMG